MTDGVAAIYIPYSHRDKRHPRTFARFGTEILAGTAHGRDNRAMKNVLMPDELNMVDQVTTEACEKLGCDDAMKAIIAARVLGFANRGERRYKDAPGDRFG